ncbi:MAG TPA: hypothetical protein VHZ50_19400, partial [Puia sp.]|nr:hypothetical protein [Puia sp.]
MMIPKNCFIAHKKLCPLLLSLSFFFLFPFFVFAQNASEKGLPFLTNFSAKDYNASGAVQNWSVIQGDKGFMYFGNGLNFILQYDGVNWRRIYISKDLDLAEPVRAMAKNRQGIIYYTGTNDFGFLEPDDSIGGMKAHSLLEYVPAQFRGFGEVRTVHVADDGYVYFQSRDRIFRLKEDASGKITGSDFKTWKPQTLFMFAFYVDGAYYAHQQNLGLYKMINDSLQLIPGSEFLGKERMQVFLPYAADKNNNKQWLIGMFKSGLFLYNGEKFTPFHTQADSIFAANLYAGKMLKDSSYALATTGKGLVIMDKEGRIIQVVNRNSGLRDETVYGLYPDDVGNLWLALDNGISRVQTSSPFTLFNQLSGIKSAVNAITRFEGDLYLGTTTGLLRFNEKSRLFEHIDE